MPESIQIQRLSSLGYKVERRNSTDTNRTSNSDLIVVFWPKGLMSNPFFKCDGPGPTGWIETVGSTLDKALEHFANEVQEQLEEKRENQ